MIPVVLSGGSGTRLWPVSRQQMPKQFCTIFEKPLQTMTLERCHKMGTPWIVTSKALQNLTEINLKDNKMSDVQAIYEPYGKNTAPAIAVLCKLLDSKGLGHEIVGIFPSDHLISKEQAFLNVVKFATSVAEKNKVVTLGITPSYPETGYGYIQTQASPLSESEGFKAYSVVKFHEKPALEKAKEFLAQGSFSWNAGIFVFKVSHMISLFEKHQPELWKTVAALKADASNLDDIYSKVANISIDYAIMEKLGGDELACIPSEFGWNDVGSWDAVASLQKGQDVTSVKGQGNFVFGDSAKHYSTVGLDDVIVVDTKDALMLVKKGHSQDVKLVVESLAQSKPLLAKEHVYEYRPWGYFEILKDTEFFKSKVIRVNPHSQLSYQSHAKREEHWTITQGTGEVVLNDQVISVKAGSHVHIPTGAKHRMRNTSNDMLEFVEVQLGSYFGEDDIVRYQDDYQRK
ncbi:mannose-1-phosphate guanylyltransferase/mannose-6-phosphate isomerase [Bdellovibrio sp. SKB1291214]|uniref:mannose-1-phosphate guanylyltransferase/mannose-6-phosphate isomerase n=1 Tax=Bdellovibrio sp. SKB1291214 TaxID=1732569 RepID=UPI000B517CB1|nr:mannose-1-phosphate guanylyltransferase/mannose-6-phosphate isomerase [Bdellovibrio sp. SKB1291214]UYL08937.1 mannose-1-phosphate guanylyltransferase/mannose-6-phosphate isomerase [Bdellovibrio sp. SKB1291214]